MKTCITNYLKFSEKKSVNFAFEATQNKIRAPRKNKIKYVHQEKTKTKTLRLKKASETEKKQNEINYTTKLGLLNLQTTGINLPIFISSTKS